MSGRPWRMRLSEAAETDLERIVRWTEERFGRRQADDYMALLAAAFDELALDGPGCPGARHRDDVRPGLLTLHVGRRGRRGRHFILFRIAEPRPDPVIEVLRVLHDAMDLLRHVPDIDPDGG